MGTNTIGGGNTGTKSAAFGTKSAATGTKSAPTGSKSVRSAKRYLLEVDPQLVHEADTDFTTPRDRMIGDPIEEEADDNKV